MNNKSDNSVVFTKEKCSKCTKGFLIKSNSSEWCTKCNYYKKDGKIIYIHEDKIFPNFDRELGY